MDDEFHTVRPLISIVGVAKTLQRINAWYLGLVSRRFSCCALTVWNSLPSFVRTADSFTSFRSQLKTLCSQSGLMYVPLIPGFPRIINSLLTYLRQNHSDQPDMITPIGSTHNGEQTACRLLDPQRHQICWPTSRRD